MDKNDSTTWSPLLLLENNLILPLISDRENVVLIQDVSPTCEGIHKRGQWPVEHFEERISAWIFLRTTEDSMLKNMGDSSAVHRGRAELYAEGKGWWQTGDKELANIL